MDAKRGFIPDDERFFSPEALELMRTASRHVRFLINDGYDLKSASTFVGNHFLLSERQRLAIVRTIATDERLPGRKEKELGKEEIRGKTVWIDGFNTVITLEVALCHSLLFAGMDGTVRDLAALRGTYRLIPETERAVRMMLEVLKNCSVAGAHILLDEPVSNSGRLKSLIAEQREYCGFDLDILLLKDVDRTLYGKECVITSDAVILDNCKSWFNLTRLCLETDDEDFKILKVW